MHKDVSRVSCYLGMAQPLVADNVGAMQIWRVTGNIKNKQSRRAESR
jgi:hypothetical protein